MSRRAAFSLPINRFTPLQRNKRVIVVLVAGILALFLCFRSFLSGVSPPSLSVDELRGLLYLVSHTDYILPDDFDPTGPLETPSWLLSSPFKSRMPRQRITQLDQAPMVVFSKSYCPYSRRAKDLLARYNLDPKPKIIEVDLRDDAENIKNLLSRLTNHNTFPNVMLLGQPLGGYDDLLELHESGALLVELERVGVQYSWSET